MKFAVLSDTHYMAESMLLPGASEEARLKNKISREVFRELAETDAFDTVFITGDLTHAGDADSHREYISMLRDVKNSGKNVYVLTATHDYQFQRAWAMKDGWNVAYKKKPWQSGWFDKDRFSYQSIVKDGDSRLSEAEATPPLVRPNTPEELWELYREFGRDQAFSIYEPDYCYCVKPEEKTWCLMLNDIFRDVDTGHTMSASYSPGCLRWIEGIVKQAREEGAFVFACTHHPLVPPVPAYKLGGGDRNMRRAYVSHMLADIGIPLVFSGHTHFADVGFAVSDKGNVLCDVTTPGLASLPPMYRIAELDDARDRLRLTAVPVKVSSEYGVKEGSMRAFYEKRFIEEYARKIDALPAGLGKCVMALKVKHVYPLGSCAKLSAAEYNEIKETRIFDIIMQCVVNMQCGDGQFTPDTPVCKFMMGLAAAADSMIDAFPLIDLRKKLQGYTVADILEPMLYNNGVPDNEAEFSFAELPRERYPALRFKSRAGDILTACLSAVALLVSPAAPGVVATALPALTLRKKLKNKTRRSFPERY